MNQKNIKLFSDINQIIKIYKITMPILLSKKHPKLDILVKDWITSFTQLKEWVSNDLTNREKGFMKRGIKQGLSEIPVILKSILGEESAIVIEEIEFALGFSIQNTSSSEILQKSKSI